MAAAVSALFVCGKLNAQVTWSGSEDNNWNDTLNWIGTPLFDGTDQLVFSSASSMTSDVNNNYPITSLTVASGAGPLLLQSDENSLLTVSSSLVDSSASAVTITVAVSGGGYVLSNGNGTLTLSGNNSYAGGTTIDSGTLAVGSNTALGSGTLMMSSGTNLTTTGGGCFTIGNAITLCGGSTVTLLGGSMGTMLELGGMISGAGGFSIAPAGDGQNTVTLTSGSSTFGGGVSVASGNTDLVIGGSSTGPAGAVTSGPLGTGTLMLGSGSDLTTLDGNSYTIGNNITLCGGGTVTLLGGYGGNNGTGLELDGAISGSSALEIVAPSANANYVVLTSPVSTFSGGVRVDPGFTSVKVGASSTGTGSNVTQGPLGTGTLMLSDGNDFDTTANGCFTIGNDITLCGTGNVYVFAANGNNMLTLGGMISGSPVLDVGYATGNNYLALTSGCSTFSGGVQVESGSTTLAVGASSTGTGYNVTQGPLGTGTLTLSSGNNLTTVGSSCYTLGNNISLSDGGTVALFENGMGKMLTLGGMIWGSSVLEVAAPGCSGANTLALTSGCSTFSGGISVDAGNTTIAIGASSTGTGSNVTQGPLGTGMLMLSAGNNLTTVDSSCYTIGNDITLCGGGTVTLLGNGMGKMLTLSGMIYGSSTLEIAAPGCSGSNTVTLASGCSTFSGGVTVDAGNTTLVVGASGSGSVGDISSGPLGTSVLTLGSGSMLTAPMSTPEAVLNDISIGAGGGSGAVTLGSGSSGTLTLMGNVSDYYGPGALVINGPVDLEGNNTYSGGTTINDTTVTVGTDTGLGTGAVTANGSTLYFNSASPSLSSPTFNSSTANFNGSSPTLTGLTLMCGSTINFAANSTPTIVDMNSDNPGSTNVINLGPADSTTTLTIQVGTDPSYYGSITGYGNLSVTSGSSGELDLRGANTYVGQTTIGSHALVVAGNNSALSTGPVTVGSGGVLGVDTGITIANQITLNNGGEIGGYGTVAPGSPETITFQSSSGLTGGRGSLGGGDPSHPVVGTLSFGSNASIEFGGGGGLQFSIMNAGGTAGVDYSTIDVAGNLNITANSGSPFNIQLVGVDSTGQLVGVANMFNASQSYSWTLLSAGSITNFSANAFSIDSTSFFSNPTSPGVFFVSQSGNDLMLNFTPVPEPSTWALMVGGVFAVGAAIRRRRR